MSSDSEDLPNRTDPALENQYGLTEKEESLYRTEAELEHHSDAAQMPVIIESSNLQQQQSQTAASNHQQKHEDFDPSSLAIARPRDTELKTEKIGAVIYKKMKHRTVLLMEDEDSKLFDEVHQYYCQGATPIDTFKKFAGRRRGDVIVKTVTGFFTYDYILKFAIPNAEKETDKDRDKEEQRKMYRQDFQEILLRKGLVLEHENTPDGEGCFVKVVTSFDILAKEAEDQKISFQLTNKNLVPGEATHSHQSLLVDQTAQFIQSVLFSAVGDRPPMAAFRRDKLSLFEAGDPKKHAKEDIMMNFFSGAQRILITYGYINEVKLPRYKKKRNATINNLLMDDVFTEMFPLHDGTFKKSSGSQCERATLNRKWASKWYGKQPLDDVRHYLGEKSALYFAWLGFYTKWIAGAAFCGIIVFLYGLSKLNNSSGTEAIVLIFDNELSPYFSFFMALWATLFLEFWKRKSAVFSYRWDTWKYERSETIRPEWKPTTARKSPITGKYELHEQTWLYRSKMAVSALVILVCITIVLITVACIIIYRVFINAANLSQSWVAPVTSGLFSLIVLIVLATIYQQIAVALTNWENHKNQTDYDDALIAKKFCFDFVNTVLCLIVFNTYLVQYSSLFYVGLIKYPAGRNVLGRQGWNDLCSYSSCLADLMIQLLIIFVGQRVIANFQEWVVPKLIKKYNEREERKKKEETKKKYRIHYGISTFVEEQEADKQHEEVENPLNFLNIFEDDDDDDPDEVPIWVKDDVLPEALNLMQEYNTMSLQFGFMTLFCTAFPLAPLFALLNNMFETRQDARKMLIATQRCVPLRAQDIGSWQKILTIVSYFAVLTNACIIAFSSQNFYQTYLSKLGPPGSNQVLVGQIVFVLLFEHVVFGFKYMFSQLIPDIPPPVKRAMEREDYIARVTVEGELPAEDDPEALAILGMEELPTASKSQASSEI